MEMLGFLSLFLTLLTIALVIYLLREITSAKTDLQMQVNQLQQNFSQRFDSSLQNMTSHLGIITGHINNTTNVVSQVEGKLGQMQEATRQIFDLAREISSLQDILQCPKMRGGLGEYLLSDLLSQCLQSRSYRLQYSFGKGTIVDAALFMGKKILCIDSKFPLENFRRMLVVKTEEERRTLRKTFFNDVKKHVNDIADKYILPEENTFDFALMFIPAENVYYELIVRDEMNLYGHCLSKKVIPVSPNTFYAYLQVILMGLRGLQISEQAKYILVQLQQLHNDLARFETEFGKIKGHLRDAQSSFEKSDLRLQRLKKKIIEMETPGIQEESDLLPAELKDEPLQSG